ncbi:MAG: YigZ family protein, partial [Flavitalea sp.]
LGADGNIFRAGDDGEPSGTAGKPILGQIDSKELKDTLVVVTRYFGGTLLGVPGLISAYKTSASLVLQVSTIIQKSIDEIFTLEYNYSQINEVMMVVKQLGCTVIDQDMNLFCLATIAIPKNKKEEALYRLGNIRDLAVKGPA